MPIDATYKSDWTPQRQAVLEQLIKAYLSKLTNPVKLYTDLDWTNITSKLDLDDREFILLKIDELFDDYLYGIQGAVPGNWKRNDNHLLQEVNDFVAELGIKKETPTSAKEPARAIIGPHRTENKAVRTQTVTSPNSIPRLVPRERRHSLELIHGSTGFKNGPSWTQVEGSLAKPAETSTTNVNVITRAEVNYRQKETKDLQPKVINRFKGVQNRLKLLGKKKEQRTVQAEISPQTPLESPSSLERISSVERQRRRSSVVGLSLPLYIRKQLQEDGAEGSAIVDSPVVDHANASQSNSSSKQRGAVLEDKIQVLASPINDEQRDGSTKGSSNDSSRERSLKKSTRLQNLLSNSQSLYSHAKEAPEPGGSHKDENESEEEDKEYISPNSLTRLYGAQLEDSDSNDEVLKALDEEDVDFVNVNDSYDEFGEVPEDQDEDYLFKI